MNKFNFIKHYVNFHLEHYNDIFTDKTGLLYRITLSFNELCQKLTSTMHRNFNGLKISESEKSSWLRKTAVTLLPSNESHHVRYQIKAYWLWDLHEMTHNYIKALGVFKK